MTATHRSVESLMMMAAVLASTAVAAGWWRSTLSGRRQVELPRESWERVKEDYPLEERSPEAHLLPHEMVQLILRANPFDPQRRAVPPPAAVTSSSGSAGPAGVQPPSFAFKGRIQMGTRQRAIVEERGSRKTHFLEVGQEVAGFKVLDISSDRVILSDPQTHAEVTLSLSASQEAGPSTRAP